MRTYDYEKCGKYFSYMFWLLVPRIVSTILSNINTPASKTIGTVLGIACNLAHMFFLWQLRSEDERFKYSAVLSAVAAVIGIVSGLLTKGQGTNGALGLSIVIAIIQAVISFAVVYNFYPALSDVMENPSPELSEKWLNIKKLYVIGLIVTIAGTVLIWIPFLGAVAVLAGAVITIVAAVMELIAMYRSADACKNYDHYMEVIDI